MILLKVYDNIDVNNKHLNYKLSDNFYDSIRDYLLVNYTIASYIDNKLVDDNI